MKAVEFQYSLKHLMWCIVVLSAGLATWLLCFHESVTVRAATADDKVFDRYHALVKQSKFRNIFILNGKFFTSTYVTLRLYRVRAGKAEETSVRSVGSSSERIALVPSQWLTITVALGESNGEHGRVFVLGTIGETCGGGHSSIAPFKAPLTHSDTFSGSLAKGHEMMLHVTGDEPFVWDPYMSVDEFRQRNGGAYLVVTGRLE